MTQTLLAIVQDILSDMESEDVNSISDTDEAYSVARVVKSTYESMVVTKLIPEHKQLIKLTSLSDNTTPTHFEYVGHNLEWVRYNVSEDADIEYRDIHFIEPRDFLSLNAASATDVVTVGDIVSGTTLHIRNDRMPNYYTSFDDKHIVMDSFKATVESTLQNSKTQAFGTVYPVFSLTDSFVPDIDDTLFPLLRDEAASTSMSLFKSGTDPKIEQRARRSKNFTQNDRFRTKKENTRNKYGRN